MDEKPRFRKHCLKPKAWYTSKSHVFPSTESLKRKSQTPNGVTCAKAHDTKPRINT